jgi:hypothetical protein
MGDVITVAAMIAGMTERRDARTLTRLNLDFIIYRVLGVLVEKAFCQRIKSFRQIVSYDGIQVVSYKSRFQEKNVAT